MTPLLLIDDTDADWCGALASEGSIVTDPSAAHDAARLTLSNQTAPTATPASLTSETSDDVAPSGNCIRVAWPRSQRVAGSLWPLPVSPTTVPRVLIAVALVWRTAPAGGGNS